MTIDVMIPVYRPDGRLGELLRRLLLQSHPVHRIYIVNSRGPEDVFPEEEYRLDPRIEISHIPRKTFDHGAVRDRYMRKSTADIMLFMVQDALPKDKYLIEKLLSSFEEERTAAAYARHMTDRGCDDIERFTRYFNYPPVSMRKSQKDVERLGIKTYFCSNVCAAYRRDWYLRAGGFEKHIIADEDMIMAYRLLKLGAVSVYNAEARVLHYHSYGILDQFRRNFDIGVCQADYPEIFSGLKSEKEGLRLVCMTGRYLIRKRKPGQLVLLFVKSAAKYAGFKLGKQYRRIPKNWLKRCTRNPVYWMEEK